jgi:predicted RNase H-like nuclease
LIVLGIDAAWTAHRASGVAVVVGAAGGWKCVAAAASYEDFYERAGCHGLLAAVAKIAGGMPDVVAVDMPLARIPITSRRNCDNLLTRAFVRNGCGVHSSSPERPGRVSSEMMHALEKDGYELAVAKSSAVPKQVIEVYPHVAVMRLLGEDYRVPYKIGRMRQYWPEASVMERKQRIRRNLARILRALKKHISGIGLRIPAEAAGPTELKRFEDTLDAIVCAWIGICFWEGRCLAYGDETAAIWVPE